MYGAGNPHEEVRRLQTQLAQMQREKGEAVGMAQLLRSKLADTEEENFNLQANMATIEAEIKYESRKKEEELHKQVSTLESKLSFSNERLKNADRTKISALRELEELKEKFIVEQKRIDAQKRLLASKKRKHENEIMAVSQSLMARMSQMESKSTAPTASAPASDHEDHVQPQPPAPQSLSEFDRLVQDNCALITVLMNLASRDLLVLFKGSTEVVAEVAIADSRPSLHQSEPMSVDDSHGSERRHSDSIGSSIGHSQSVFSQIAGQAQAQAQASLMTFAKEANLTQAAYANERAKDLHDALARMIRGEASAMALAPVLIRYLAAPTDLDVALLSSVMRLLYCVMENSECFQNFVLVSSSPSASSAASKATSNMQHPRISFPGLRYSSLAEYLASQKEERRHSASSDVTEEHLSEQMQLRAKLMSALCRVIKNNLNNAVVVESGLSVLALWVDLGVTKRFGHADFRSMVSTNVIQDVVMAPKGVSCATKAMALSILTQLLHFSETFQDIDASARRTLLFNRCAKMLSQPAKDTSARELQHMIIRVFLGIVVAYPSTGVRFVLESTHGQANDRDGDRCVVYHLAQLLHHETFDARTLGEHAVKRLVADATRVRLIQEAFGLLALLVRYIDLNEELGGPDKEHSFLSVLYLLRSKRLDLSSHDMVSKTANALITLMNAPQ